MELEDSTICETNFMGWNNNILDTKDNKLSELEDSNENYAK